MKLVKNHTVDGHDVKIYNDKGHFIVKVDNELFGSAENERELRELLDEISEIEEIE